MEPLAINTDNAKELPSRKTDEFAKTLRSSWVYAAAATVLLSAGGWFWHSRVNENALAASVMPVFEDIVRLHSSELPADVRDAPEQQVRRYFRNKLNFAVRPARFEHHDAELVGARLSNVNGQRAAALYYDVDGQRVTVVVFDQPEFNVNPASRAHFQGREVLYKDVHGYTVPVQQHGGLTYAFTGDLDSRSLLKLAASARVMH